MTVALSHHAGRVFEVEGHVFSREEEKGLTRGCCSWESQTNLGEEGRNVV